MKSVIKFNKLNSKIVNLIIIFFERKSDGPQKVKKIFFNTLLFSDNL